MCFEKKPTFDLGIFQFLGHELLRIGRRRCHFDLEAVLQQTCAVVVPSNELVGRKPERDKLVTVDHTISRSSTGMLTKIG